jgi:hypothetical protein
MSGLNNSSDGKEELMKLGKWILVGVVAVLVAFPASAWAQKKVINFWHAHGG